MAVFEKATLWLILAIGVALRVVHYFTAGSLWHDEACLALDIVQRNFFQLLKPLDYDQAAPVGYLWLVKATTVVFGSSGELALRLTSLIASIAVLVLLALLSRRVFGCWCAIVALSIAAISPLWIYYAAELKPYPLDAALALWMMLSFEALVRKEAAPAEWNRLFAKAAVGLLLSQTIILILLPIGTALAFYRAGKYRVKALALLAMSCAIAGGLYFAVYRPEANGFFLRRYWAPYELSIWAPGLKTRLIDTAYNIFFRSLDSVSLYAHTAGVALLAAAGLSIAFARVGVFWTATLVSPFVMLFLASCVGVYPIAPRTLLFALPLLIMLVALPIAAAGEWVSSRQPLWGAGLGLLVLVFAVRGAQVARLEISKTFPRTSERAIRAYESSRNCDPVYVFSSSVPVWEYYTRYRHGAHFPSPDLMHKMVERNHKRVFASEGPIPGALETYQEGCRPLLFGEVPPDESQVLPKYDWAAAEMRRIAGTGAHHVYVFGELFAPTALASLAREAAKCGGAEKTLFGQPGRGYLGEITFANGSCR